MGVVVWPMVYFEADDALASAAAKAAQDDRVKQVFICTPDKDLSQSVVGTRVVQLDRRREILRDEAGVVAKFGVKPQSIPDYLAVVGDSADGFPGLPGWGAKAAALTLSQYPHLEDIPKDWREWNPSIRKARPFLNRCSTHGMKPCCFAPSRPCGWMCRSLRRSEIFAGKGRIRTLKNSAFASSLLIFFAEPSRRRGGGGGTPAESA